MRPIVNGRHLNLVARRKIFLTSNRFTGMIVWIAMKPQFGVCKNKVGCSFAYTGEKIPVPPDSKCPECGQPLARGFLQTEVAPRFSSSLGLVLLLILIGGAAALFAFKDQIFHLAFNKPETSQKVVEAQGEDKLASSSPAQGQESSTPADSPNARQHPTRRRAVRIKQRSHRLRLQLRCPPPTARINEIIEPPRLSHRPTTPPRTRFRRL